MPTLSRFTGQQSILTQKEVMRSIAISTVAALIFSVTVPISAMALEDSPAQTNGSETVNTTEVKNALQNVDGVLEQADQTAISTDSDSAIKAATAGATIDVPKDASDGVSLSTPDGPTMDITLPNADEAKAAQQVAPGTVAYPGADGSANAVQATEDGGVRMLTVIDNPNAPTSYDYKVSVPSGGHIEMTEEGGAVVFDNEGNSLVVVATPWAKDANGIPVKTYFTTDGLTLTQHVEHNVPGVAYPVTADPWWNPFSWLHAIWRGALGCVGGRELVDKGVKYFISKHGAKRIISRLGTRWVPVLGWVSCGYGAWEGIRY